MQVKRACRTVTFPGVVSPDITLAPCGAAPRPVFSSQWRAIWRTSLLPTGPVTARISRAAPNAVEGVAWGSGPRSSSTRCRRCWAPTTTPRISCPKMPPSPPRIDGCHTCGWAVPGGCWKR
ncbi:hypothetical protein I552_8070 [Mycobacterium xenopi 3993]|nr:hypothetical protein I552_8070 [Mycobacterium xenopi 3993]